MIDVLSEEALLVKEELKEASVLQPLAEHLLSENKQVFILFCGDGKHSLDLTGHHADLCGIDHGSDDDLFHQGALNGGVLCIPSTSPLARLRGLPQDLVMLMNIEYALKLKGNHGQIAAYAHAPCGAAREVGLGFTDVVDNTFRAKWRIRQVFRRPIFTGEVASYLHVCRLHDGSLERNTYFGCREHWEEWLTLPKNTRRHDEWHAYKESTETDPGWVPEELIKKLQQESS